MFGFRKKELCPILPEARPVHLAIIMDGNGRWAKKRGLPRLAGHKAGAETVLRVVRYCAQADIRYLTLYAFSTENWRRPEQEVSGLMRLLENFLDVHGEELEKNQVRLRVIGDMQELDAHLRERLDAVARKTQQYQRQLIIALNYSGRRELARAARQIAEAVRDGRLRAEEVDERTISSFLYAPDVPDPDLIVRTSGEFRISNFLLWECAYSEFYITDALWPDFSEREFSAALQAYAGRERRFGGLKEEKKS